MTTQEFVKISQAMEAANGDATIAAMALGMDYGTLKDALHHGNPDLKMRWTKTNADAPSEIDLISPRIPKLPDPSSFTEDDVRLGKAFAMENMKLKRGVECLGLTEEESKLAIELQQFHRGNFKESVEIVGAGMTRIGIKIQVEFSKTQARLEDVRKMLSVAATGPEGGRAFLATEENNLMMQLISICQEGRKVAEVSFKGAYMLAMAQLKQKNAGNKIRKPGFSQPIDIQEAKEAV